MTTPYRRATNPPQKFVPNGEIEEIVTAAKTKITLRLVDDSTALHGEHVWKRVGISNVWVQMERNDET